MSGSDPAPRSDGLAPWWKPAGASWAFLAILAADVIILWLAWNRDGSGGNNDAAGNAMAAGFFAAYVAIAGIVVGVIALLFAVIRHRVTRLVLTCLLGLFTIPLLALLL